MNPKIAFLLGKITGMLYEDVDHLQNSANNSTGIELQKLNDKVNYKEHLICEISEIFYSKKSLHNDGNYIGRDD